MPMPKNMHVIAAVEKNKEAKGSNSKEIQHSKKETDVSGSLALSCGAKKAAALLKGWIRTFLFV